MTYVLILSSLCIIYITLHLPRIRCFRLLPYSVNTDFSVTTVILVNTVFSVATKPLVITVFLVTTVLLVTTEYTVITVITSSIWIASCRQIPPALQYIVLVCCRSYAVLDRAVAVAVETVLEHSGDHGVRRAGNSHQRVLRHNRVYHLVEEQTAVAGQEQHAPARSEK